MTVTSAQPCTSCQLCDAACPEALETSTLIALIALCRSPSTTGTTHAERIDDLQDYGLANCTQCGECTMACPSRLPLADLLTQGKALLSSETKERAASAHWKARFEKRQRRLAARKTEKLTKKSAPQRVQSAQASLSPANAQDDIAAAVARVKAKRAAITARPPTAKHVGEDKS